MYRWQSLVIVVNVAVFTNGGCALFGQDSEKVAPLYVTVVSHFDRPWAMDSADLEAMVTLTRRHPDMKWSHLYNPVAYTQDTPLRDDMERFVVESRDRFGSEIGVHLHMYESLVTAAGVTFKDSPSVNALQVAGSRDQTGYAVPITAYKPDELRSLFDFTLQKFSERNLGRPRSFCAGFYATSNSLQQVIASKGFHTSAAAFPWGVIYGQRYAPSWESLSGWAPIVTHLTAPYRVSKKSILPGGRSPYFICDDEQPLIEVPQTCKIDWMVSSVDLKTIISDHLQLARHGVPTAVCLALHETSAAEHLDKFDDALDFVDQKRHNDQQIPIRYVTLSELRQRFLLLLPTAKSNREDIRALKARGATIVERAGRVAEVRLNGTNINNSDLNRLTGFAMLTDLSLERTQVDDRGMACLTGLGHLEWLNLYQTQVGDRGLKFISYLPRLQYLPMGETNVTDKGLVHLKKMIGLKYLGLRATGVTDAGLKHCSGLTGLTGLHLGETNITDEGIAHITDLPKLSRLWLHDTAVTDSGILQLQVLRKLTELYVYRANPTIAGVRKLKQLLPNCRIYYRSSTQNE